ncbi:MAG: glutathione S-transferase N-terminal domain-containing protein [Solirubrobacteraceae bacterium]
MLELYQAEWCPFSHQVRQRLTELGEPFIAHQVPAEPEDRQELRRLTGTDEIPTLVLADGTVINETDRILEYLDEHCADSADADAHRERDLLEGGW